MSADAIREEARVLVRSAAEPSYLGEHIKSAIVRSARRLGLSFYRTRKLWYGNVKTIPAHEMDEIRLRWLDLQKDAENASLETALIRTARDALTIDPASKVAARLLAEARLERERTLEEVG